jgi:hypothetical protein
VGGSQVSTFSVLRTIVHVDTTYPQSPGPFEVFGTMVGKLGGGEGGGRATTNI